jgi:Flp pilus assembly protein TadD
MKLKEAAEEYRKAVNLEPNNSKWHRKVGGVLFAGGNVADAEASLKEAIRLEPNDSEYHLMLATILDKVGETDSKRDAEAEAQFREAIRLEREDSPFASTYHWWLGRFFEKRGKYEQAELAYREAIRVKPEDKTSLPYLANVLEKQGKREEAKAVRDKAKQ